ncbi:uncharacterized protein LOC116853208 [Odontomachus brunneus]|uniref:uncharacterized protein LOC116853208 n=1 Tax=Odontomachus brunneus TaxID=486640 RepID=UPI0013F1CCB2|nr:uncharacterized protein LOC116853208 [Odontomachus brunneus]
MKRKLHAASVKVVRKLLYTEEVRQTLSQVDDALEVFEVGSHDQHSVGDDSLVYSEVEENRNNLSSDDNELDHNDCNTSFEQEAEAEAVDIDLDEEFAINIQDQNDIQSAEDSDKYMSRFLKEWAMRGVAHRKVDELLAGLRPLHSSLPKSHKTLLQTPRRVELQRNGEGSMWYKGCLIGEAVPFIIGVWHGFGKADSINAFLTDFIHEVDELALNGYNFHGSRFPFKIGNYILDAVARQYVKCISSHNSVYACEKCTVRGARFRNREIFLDFNAPLRTDESFRRKDQLDHHDGDSPLEAMRSDNNRMISQFRLDPMHLLFEGAFKRWVQYLCGYQAITYGKISRLACFNLCSGMIDIAPWIPMEFSRRPRSLYYQAKFKATERRHS